MAITIDAPNILNKEAVTNIDVINEGGANTEVLFSEIAINNDSHVKLLTGNKFLETDINLDTNHVSDIHANSTDVKLHMHNDNCFADIEFGWDSLADPSIFDTLNGGWICGQITLYNGKTYDIFPTQIGRNQIKDVLARPSSITSGDKLITVIPDEGYDALSKVNITVPLQFKSTTITPTSFDNGNISVTPNAEKLLSSVTVIKPTETKTITENGTGIDVAGYGQVDVNIPSGPSLPDGFTAIATGKHTLSTPVKGGSSFNVTHNLGVVPDMFVFWTPTNIATTYSMLYAARSSQFQWNGNSNLCIYHGNSTSALTFNNPISSYGIKGLTDTTATITTYSSSTSYYWRAGTYNWMAIKF